MDEIFLRNGGYLTSPVLKTYCGNEDFSGTVISHSNHLYIKFTTDERVSGKGFSLDYDSGATGNIAPKKKFKKYVHILKEFLKTSLATSGIYKKSLK